MNGEIIVATREINSKVVLAIFYLKAKDDFCTNSTEAMDL